MANQEQQVLRDEIAAQVRGHDSQLHAHEVSRETAISAIESIGESSEQYRLERALRDSELKYRALFEHAGVAILVLKHNRILDCNARALVVYGCTRSQILGATPWEFSPPTQPDGSPSSEKGLEKIRLALCDGPQRFEWTPCRGDRTPFTAEITLNRLDLEGEVLLLAVVRDITERTTAEEQLRQSEATLRSVFYAAPVGVCVLKDRVFQRANQFWHDELGYPEHELIGKSTRLFFESDEEWERVGQILYPRLHQDGKASVRTRFLRADGVAREVVLTIAPVHQGDSDAGTVGIVYDITERSQAERRVLRLNRLYATLSRVNQIMVRASSREKLFEDVCQVAVEYGQFRLAWIGLIDTTDQHVKSVASAGYDQGYLANISIRYLDEALGRGPTGTAIREGRCVTCQDMVTDPLMAPWRAAALQRGYRSSAAVPIRQANRVIGALMVYSGETQQFDTEEEALLVEMGQTISYALDSLEHDTQRRQAEDELHRMNLELERRVALRTAELNESNTKLQSKNQELKEFAYSVSHDLKAPLRGIAGYAQELGRKHRAGLSERAQFCLNQILTATSHLDQLIEDLLHYSRLDSETALATDVDLDNLIQSILHDRELILSEQHVELTLNIPVRAVRVWERGLAQVLTNLIDNAIKYSRKATPPRLRLVARELDRAWQLSIEDNGIGFDLKYHDRIFGLFNRLVRMEDYEGTGAGLAIVKKVVDKLGGRVWAESTLGHGATFFVELPKPRTEPSVEAENSGEATHG